MKYRYLFFDLDGTLLDTLDDLKDSVNVILSSRGFAEITREEAARFLGNGAKHLVHCALKGNASPEQEEIILKEYKDYYQDHCRVRTAPYPGVMEMLRNLRARGVRLAVVSNKPDGAVKELNDAFFEGMMEVAVGETPAIRRKPAPDTVLEAMRVLGADPVSSVYIGDTEVDIETAKNSGLPCLTVTWGFRNEEELKAAGAETIVHSAKELEKALTDR